MKRFFLLTSILFLLLVPYYSTAQNFTCDTHGESSHPESESNQGARATTCPIESDRLPIINVRTNIHFIGSDSGNFYPGPDDDWDQKNGQKAARSLLNKANEYLSDIIPSPTSLAHFLGDSRIRFQLYTDPNESTDEYGGIWYYDDASDYPGLQNLTYGDHVLHIVISDQSPVTCTSRGDAWPSANRIRMYNWYQTLLDPSCPGGFWTYANLLNHELGHMFGLNHAFCPESANPCAGVDLDPVVECNNNGVTSCFGGNCNSWTSGSKNMMAYVALNRALTPCQYDILINNALSGKTYIGLCDVETTPLVIESGTDEVWDYFRIQKSDVIIEPGASLTISCEVRMAEDRRFTVKRGARLTVDDGTITSLCEEPWRGIYVWGNAEKEQPDAFGVQALDDAGIVIVQNNSLIEHAKTAIIAEAVGIPYAEQLANRGGLVHAENSFFYDNRWAAQFMKYDSLNKSKFYKCHFLEEGDYYDGTIGVSMWACKGITFEENIFENLDGFGIMGIDHSIKVINNNSFLNNRNGIESYASTPFSVATTIGEPGTTPNYFLNNEVHILAEASGAHDGLNIYGNTLNDAIVGIYIDGPTQYNIIDNAFYGQSLGILSRQSGDYTNFIDCNEIQNVEMGIMVEGRNRFTQIRGNCFVQSAYNIWLTSDNGIPGQIRFDQGDNSAPAINSFSQNNIYDIYAPFNSTLPFRYFVPFEETDLSCNGSYLFPNTAGNYQTISTPYKGNFCSELDGRPEDDERPDDDRPGEDRPGRGLVSQVQDALQNADFDLVESLLKKDNSAKAKQWLFGIKLKTNDYSSARKVLHELPVNTEEDRIFKAIQKINLNFRTATEPFLLNASEETFLYDVAYSTSSMKGYARALLILLKGEHFDISLNLPNGNEVIADRSNQDNLTINPFSVYPNPVKDNFSITYPTQVNKQMTIQLFDAQGRELMSQALNGTGELNISTTDFTDGVYFLNVSDESGVIYNTKFVVVK